MVPVVLFFLLPLGYAVNQTADVFSEEGRNVTLACSQRNTDFNIMYWFRQRPGEGLEPIVHFYVQMETMEERLKERFSAARVGASLTLTLRGAQLSDSGGVYFCAKQDPMSSADALYFAKGTKLTVLEPGINITRPKVKVLPPSNREGCKKTNRTLVCVATGFYPDHITVSWKLNGVEVTSGVRTDDTALRDEDNRFYSITSRLRVSYRKWFDTRSTFTCLTRFYNGSGYPEDADSINGVNGGGMDREYLLKSGLTAKLSYSVFIAKSFLYGLFVSAVVWKIRSSAAKRYE